MECGHGGGFGRGEGAGVDAAQEHDGHRQRQGTTEQDAGPFRQRYLFFTRHVAFGGDDVHHPHHQERHQETRHHTTEEQGPHRRTRNQGIDDHRDRRRNDGPERGTGHHHSTGKTARVFRLLQHLANSDQAWASGVGNGAATHAREDHTDQNVHLGQATAHAAHQHAAEVKNAVTDRACIHDVGGKHKQRHGQQHIAVVQAVADLLHRQAQVLALHQQVTNPCGQHRKPDGHPHQHARHQNAGKNKKCKSHRRNSVSRPLPRMASHTFQALRSTSEMSKRTKGRKIQLNGTSSTGEASRPINFT